MNCDETIIQIEEYMCDVCGYCIQPFSPAPANVIRCKGYSSSNVILQM